VHSSLRAATGGQLDQVAGAPDDSVVSMKALGEDEIPLDFAMSPG
jgi:hypothetical protein